MKRKRNLTGRDLLDWIESKSMKNADGCLEWQGALNQYGYGCVRSQGKTHLVHRLAYSLRSNEAIAGLVIRHNCDNPKCLAEDHLVSGTQAENLQDMSERGRAARGVKASSSKLSDEDIMAIRASNASRTELARLYGVCHQQISMIVRRKRWAHI